MLTNNTLYMYATEYPTCTPTVSNSTRTQNKS